MSHHSKFVTFPAIAAIVVFNASATGASEVEITVDGFISSGSSAGLIYDSKHDYEYAGDTRNLDVLQKGRPIRMGDGGTMQSAIQSRRQERYEDHRCRRIDSWRDGR